MNRFGDDLLHSSGLADSTVGGDNNKPPIAADGFIREDQFNETTLAVQRRRQKLSTPRDKAAKTVTAVAAAKTITGATNNPVADKEAQLTLVVAAEQINKHASNVAPRALRYATFAAHADWITSGRFFNHDRLVLTASYDALVKVWRFPDMALVQTLGGATECVSRAVATPDSQHVIASSWDESLYMWNVETGKIEWTYKCESLLTCCDINNDGNVIVASSDGDKAIWLFDVRDRAPIKYKRDFLDNAILTCKMASDGRHFGAGGACDTVKIYDMVSNATTITLSDCGNIVSDLAFSPDGKRLSVAAWDTLVKVYDISEGAYRLHGVTAFKGEHAGCVSCCAYNSDSTLLVSGGYGTTLCAWDARNHDMQFRLQPHESAWVTACAFSADGECIISCSKTGEVRFWRLSDLQQTPAFRARLRERGKVFQCSACQRPFSVNEVDSKDIMDEQNLQHNLCVFCSYTPNMQAIDVEQRFEALISKTLALPNGADETNARTKLSVGEQRINDVKLSVPKKAF